MSARLTIADGAREAGCFADGGLARVAGDGPSPGRDPGGVVGDRATAARGAGRDGICVLVDAFAAGTLTALRDAWRSVPDDVPVATRCGGRRAELADPPLTALDLHLPQVAERAVDLLLRVLAGETPSETPVGPAPSLVTRRSTGA